MAPLPGARIGSEVFGASLGCSTRNWPKVVGGLDADTCDGVYIEPWMFDTCRGVPTGILPKVVGSLDLHTLLHLRHLKGCSELE